MSETLNLAPVKMSSNRNFGLVFTAFFAIVAILPSLHGEPVRIWAIAIAAAFFATSLLLPKILYPLNRLWFYFGLLLHAITSPIIMGIIFFVVLTPMALIARVQGRDILGLCFSATLPSYWKVREPAGPDPQSFRNQF